MSQHDWQKRAALKKTEIDSLLPLKWKIPGPTPGTEMLRNATGYPQLLLSPDEVRITEGLTASELLEELAAGKLTAMQVTRAFCHRATIAHQLVNCLSEVFFDHALDQAAKLDEYFKINSRPVGPLHGLPISLKDQFRVQNTETSLGYISHLGPKESVASESYLVKKLRELGAIFYVKTNVPTSLMAIETNNNIIGYTWNAHNRLLSSGGSSGGEASLLAMRGSVIGLGTDIGSSIRLPAGVSGLYGLKPSSHRLPYLGVANSMEGQETVSSVIGPMGHSIEDLQLMMRSILRLQPWVNDPKTLPFPWLDDVEEEITRRIKNGGLTFAVMEFDGLVMPHPPILRALKSCVAALKVNGHQVVDWTPPSHSQAFNILWKVYAVDGGADVHKALSAAGEKPVPQIAVSYGNSFGHLPVSTVNDIWNLQKEKYDYQTQYLEYWNSTSARGSSGRAVDAVILPIAPSASFKPGESLYFGYTGIGNVLDAAVAVMPVTKADTMVDVVRHDYEPVSEMDEKIWRDYDPELFHGMPVGIQVMCKRLEEEKVLAIAQELERCLFRT